MSAGAAVAPLTSAEVSVKLFVDDASVVRPLELIAPPPPVFERLLP